MVGNIIVLMAVIMPSAAPEFVRADFISISSTYSTPCREQKIQVSVENASTRERADLKADEIIRCHSTGIFENTQYGLRVEIQSIEKIEGGIEIIARAWKGERQLGFGADGSIEWERFRIFNPPILVDDSHGAIIREWSDDTTGEIHKRTLREDHGQALQDTLAHTIRVSGKSDIPIVAGSVGNTTSTFFPDPEVGSTSVDGRSGRDVDPAESWATIRTGAGNFSNDSGATLVASIGTLASSNSWATLQVAMALFDTSSIADTDTISSGTLSYFGSAKTNNFEQSVVATNSNPDSNTAVTNADYTDHTTIMTTEVSASRVTVANWSTIGYNDFTLNAAGLTQISKIGISKFGYMLSGDFDNVEPIWQASVGGNAQSYSVDAAGTANDPKLVVVHTSHYAPSAPPQMSSPKATPTPSAS